jgi:CheY-like chemotaxis protein
LPPSVRLKLDCATGLPAVVVDPTQIRQLVMNLITNAADAIAGGQLGEVVVRVQMLDWQPANAPEYVFGERLPAGAYVVVEVCDDGAGMTPATLLRIFDPFFTTKASGKGLGLSAVLGIVQGHGAMLCVHSAPGAGSRFELVLPPTSAAAVAKVVESGPVDRRFSGCVLLIDDEPVVREFVEAALATLGLDAILAHDGREGLALFETHRERIALILIDQSMPGMSGVETLQRMRRLDAGVPAILMSGYDEQQVSAALADSGFSGFLQKPFRFAQLRDMLLQILEPTV